MRGKAHVLRLLDEWRERPAKADFGILVVETIEQALPKGSG